MVMKMAPAPRQKAGGKPTGVMTSLKAWFGFTPTPAPRVPTRTEKSGTEEDHWVPLSLDEVLSRDPNAEVHLVTLRQFRVAVGDIWPRIASKAVLLADATLRQVAGPGCLMKQSQEENFLLSFPRLTPMDGRRRATAAAIALGQKLVGAKFKVTGSTEAEPAICMVSVKASDLVGPDGRLDPQALDLVAAQSTPVGDAPTLTTEDTGTATAESIALKKLSRTAPAEGDPEWEKLRHTRARGDLELVPIQQGQKKKKVEDMQWVPISRK